MTMTGLQSLDDSVHTTNVWLNGIMQELHTLDRQEAFQAMRATLHVLRDRLPVDEAAHLAAQLPMVVRGVYYEGWRPAGKPDKCRDRKEFFGKMQQELTHEELRRDPERTFRAVARTLSQHVTGGEVDEVKQALPAEIRQLWPEPTPVV
jgi:uncharacterized protein (DUF2267 family)